MHGADLLRGMDSALPAIRDFAFCVALISDSQGLTQPGKVLVEDAKEAL